MLNTGRNNHAITSREIIWQYKSYGVWKLRNYVNEDDGHKDEDEEENPKELKLKKSALSPL
jgi:hypothetical protein